MKLHGPAIAYHCSSCNKHKVQRTPKPSFLDRKVFQTVVLLLVRREPAGSGRSGIVVIEEFS